MNRLFAALLATTVAPISVFAEPAPVLSGEHSTFTRVVTPINGSDWSVSQVDRSVALTFDTFDGGFDIAGVFDLIPRNRIQSVSASGNILTLELGCDCAVSATTERDLYVVLDVAQKVSDLQTPQFAITTTVADQETATAQQTKFAQVATPVPLGWNPEIMPAANPEIVNALQRRLTNELETATRRGVLSAVPNAFSMTPAKQSPISTEVFSDLVATTEDNKTTTDAARAQDQNLANLRISTSRDLPETFRDLAEITSLQGQVCPPDAALDVSSWGDDRPFADQMAQARQGLYGEFDRIDPDVALGLARTYLYFGFGAEARDVLKLDKAVAENAPYLITLAMLMDDEKVATQNPLTGMTECEGEIALWATLVAPMPPRGALPTSDSALRTLNAMPSHLRLLLAPKLHRVLLAYGDPNGASATLRSLKRLPGELPPAAQIAQANSTLEEGETEQATRQLAEVVEENAIQSPIALIALVDAKLKSKQPISAETAQLVDAYAQELRESELGPELRRVQILSLAQSGQFDAAFMKLNVMEAAPVGLLGQTLRKLTSNANDIVFLDHALVQPARDLEKLAQRDVLALATRFLELGFPAEAERVMDALPAVPRQRDQQLLAAQVSLAMGKPFRAQADLLNLQDDEANRLRAAAKRMSGAHDEAHVLYEQTNSTQEATETAWLSEDWRNLTPQETPTFGAAATLPEPVEAATGTAGMLARSSALLDQSVQTRQTLQDLLSAEDLRISDLSE